MTALIDARPQTPEVAPRVVRAVWGGLLLVLTGSQLLYAFGSRRPYTSGPSPLFGVPSRALTETITRGTAVAVVGVAVAVIAVALPVLRWPRAGGTTLLAYAALGTSVAFSGWWHGSSPSVGLVALPAVAVAIGLFPRPPLAWLERRVVLVLRLHVWVSLAAAAVAPSWAVKEYGASVVPGLGTRLAGVTPHPNALGPLAVALLVLEWRRAPRSRTAIVAAATVLVWTQSKTSWAAAAIVIGIVVAGALRRRGPQRSKLPALVLLAVLGVSAYVGLGVLGDGAVEDRRDTSTETFTGRTAIWEVTLEVWREEPILGYGTALWDDDMDARYASRVGFPPGHAHNQLVQTLGQAGLVGAAALVVFLWSFAGLARRADARTAGAAGALFLVLVVRCFSEPPFQSTPYAASSLLTVLTLAYALAAVEEVDDDG